MNNQIQFSESHLDQYSQLVDEATLAYFAWVKQILNLSVGSLTVLIALRNQIAQGIPKATILLQISWLLFAVSIVLSLFALQGHHVLLFRTAQDCAQAARDGKQNGAGVVRTPRIHRRLGQVVPWIFVSAIVFLTLFGIVNLTPETKTKPENPNEQATSLEHHKNTQNEDPREQS